MTVRHLFTSDGENHSVTLHGETIGIRIVDGTHPSFAEIVRAARAKDEATVSRLLNVGETLDTVLPAGFERQGSVIRYNGEPLSETLSQSIIGILDTDGDLAPLSKFAVKLEANVSKHSRDQLFAWMNNYGINITEDGDLIAYKGVNVDLTSCSSGPGIVNGEHVNGNLDNSVGNIVAIERRYVDDNPNSACSTGLHVGNWDYASHFGPQTVTVEVNPANVVSVPHDCNAAKVRVSEYKVVDTAPAKWERSTVWSGTQGTDYDYLTADSLTDEDIYPEDEDYEYEQAYRAGAVDAQARVAPVAEAWEAFDWAYTEGYRDHL